MSSRISRLRFLTRAEWMLARIYAQRAAARGSWLLVVTILALVAYGLLNFSAYSALLSLMSSALASLLLALVNLFLAGIVFFASRHVGPSAQEEKLALEIRELAYNEVSQDLDQAKAQLEQISSKVKILGGNLSSISSLSTNMASGLSNSLVQSLPAILALILNALRRKP